LRRDPLVGDGRFVLDALVLAVEAGTGVGFVADRADRALAIEAKGLLGGVAVVRRDSSVEGGIADAAVRHGLAVAHTVGLNSMVRSGEGTGARLQMADLRAMGDGFPLRGTYRVQGADGAERDAEGVPAPGSIWLARAGAVAMGVEIGDTIELGTSSFTLSDLVTVEPDAAFDYFDVAPRVFLNLADLPATGLVQEGSRIRYRLFVAGDAADVEAFVADARAALGRGQGIETIADTRMEVRSSLDRAGRFFGLAALVSVVLAAVAVAMAARRHSERHLSGSAVMRCLGAQQRTLVAIHVGELVLLGLLASVVGIALAYVLQLGIGGWLAQQMSLDIPAAGWLPALQGLAVGLLVLLAFGAPPVLALRRVPALRVLRRDLDPTEPSAWIVVLAGLGGLAALLWWQAGSAELAGAMLVGLVAAFAALALLAWALVVLVRRLRGRLRGPLRYGLANVSRRAATSVAQVTALGLGLMALLLLTFVRTDLLDRWQMSLADDAPNRFIINVQDDQVDAVAAFIAAQGLATPDLYPMVRGRLVMHNGEAVSGKDYEAAADEAASDDDDAERGRRWAEREFNLSTATTLRDDNKVTAGAFWPQEGTSVPELSVEEEFAADLGWKIGDTVGFDIAGQRMEATITSFRSVDWESFRPNFFVIASPGVLDGYPASHVTAVAVPSGDVAFTPALVEQFPNLTVIDIEQVLNQVRQTADQVSTVVEVVFWFSFAAGLLVLLAAVSASQDERLLEGGVMRVLGGSRWQLRLAQASEFAAIGLLAGLVAAIAASILSGVVAKQVFDLPWEANWSMAVAGGALGMLAALVAGLLATRSVLDAPPSVTLRELDN